MERNWVGLEELVSVADAGSFVGASRLLGVSTSHVSRAIYALEDRVKTPLFYRTTRRVRPTDAGLELARRARRLIEERDAAFALIRGDGAPQGELRITCSVHLGERYIAPITRRFANQHPEVSVHLDLTNRLVDLIGEGFDLGVRTGDIGDSRLLGHVIGERRFHLCATPSYIGGKGEPKSIGDLRQHKCLVGNSPIWRFKSAKGPLAFEPTGRWRCSSSAAVAEAALAGMGICQLPALYVAKHLRSGALVRLLAHTEEAPELIWAVHPQRSHSQPKVNAMIRQLESELLREMISAEDI